MRGKSDVPYIGKYINLIHPAIEKSINVQDTYVDIDIDKLDRITDAVVEKYMFVLRRYEDQRSDTHLYGLHVYKLLEINLKKDLRLINDRILNYINKESKDNIYNAVKNNSLRQITQPPYKRIIKKYDYLLVNTGRFIDALNYIVSQVANPDPETYEDFIQTVLDPREVETDIQLKGTQSQSYQKVQRDLIDIIDQYISSTQVLSKIYKSVILGNDSKYLDYGNIMGDIIDDIHDRYVEQHGEFKTVKRGRKTKEN